MDRKPRWSSTCVFQIKASQQACVVRSVFSLFPLVRNGDLHPQTTIYFRTTSPTFKQVQRFFFSTQGILRYAFLSLSPSQSQLGMLTRFLGTRRHQVITPPPPPCPRDTAAVLVVRASLSTMRGGLMAGRCCG
jgi:hypothetical protein